MFEEPRAQPEGSEEPVKTEPPAPGPPVKVNPSDWFVTVAQWGERGDPHKSSIGVGMCE